MCWQRTARRTTSDASGAKRSSISLMRRAYRSSRGCSTPAASASRCGSAALAASNRSVAARKRGESVVTRAAYRSSRAERLVREAAPQAEPAAPKKKGGLRATLRPADPELLDRDLLRGRGLLLRQVELQHAVVVLRLHLRLVDLVAEAERARGLAEVALAVHQPLAFLHVLLTLHLGGDRHLVAVDVHLDVLLLDAGDFRQHLEATVLLGHVDLHARGSFTAFAPQGTNEKALEQVVEQLAERIVTGHVCHLSLLELDWVRARARIPQTWGAPARFQGGFFGG